MKNTLKKPRPGPASACPMCFRDGEIEPQLPGLHSRGFYCRCGARWTKSHKDAQAHGTWLASRLGRVSRDPKGDA